MTKSNRTARAIAWRAARAVLVPLLLASLGSVSAADYPDKPVRLVVPVPPGGPTDAATRVLAEKLGELWKQPVIVDNKPGAQNIIGTDLVSRAAPDGYTLLILVDSTVTMLPFRKQKLPYDPASLIPVTTIADGAFLLTATGTLKVQSLPELLQTARARPGEVTVGIGAFNGQAILVRFSKLANVQFLPVIYKGGGELMAALLSGNINVAFLPYVSVQPYISTDRVKVLATTGVIRNPATPDIPTLKELGYPGFESGLWIGLAAPKGTPDKIIQKLSDDVGKVMEMPEVMARVRAMGLTLMPGTPASIAELIRVDSEKWKPIVPTLTLD